MIEMYDRNGIVANEQTGFVFEMNSNPRDLDSFKVPKESLDYQDNYIQLDDWIIFPYGSSDDLPKVIKQAVQENSTAPGIIEKQVFMILGNGPFLYTEKIQDGQILRDWINDVEIQDWLDSWGDYTKYLQKCAFDYAHMKGHFTKIIASRAQRLGEKNKLSKGEHLNIQKARLCCKKDSVDLKPTHVVVTDNFRFDNVKSFTHLKFYPLFDPANPFEHTNSIQYCNQYTFGDDNYSTPPLFGSLEWLRRSTATPLIFKALSKNSINVKYHVESPQEFWDDEEEKLKQNAAKSGRAYSPREIVLFRQNFLKGLLDVLTSDENAGKVFHSRSILEKGTGINLIERGWKITAIPQNIKDFVESQIKISERADRSLSANMGLNQGISNVGEAGKVNGGSEQIYAYQNFVNSSVYTPELVICQSINAMIKANFPNKRNIKIGFHRTQAQTQSNINPEKRVVPQ